MSAVEYDFLPPKNSFRAKMIFSAKAGQIFLAEKIFYKNL